MRFLPAGFFTWVILVCALLRSVAQAGSALPAIKTYLEDRQDWGTSQSNFSTLGFSLPSRVIAELLQSADNESVLLVLGYLSKEASQGNRRAESVIVAALYIAAQKKSGRMEIGERIQADRGYTTIEIPRIFNSVIRGGFPRDPKGWRSWFDTATPRASLYGKTKEDDPRLWFVDFENTPVTEALKFIEKETGMAIFYTPASSEERKIRCIAADIRVSEVLNLIAEPDFDIEYIQEGIRIAPKRIVPH